MVLSTMIFSFLVAGAMGVITSGRNMVAHGVERSDLEERARTVAARLARELLAGRVMMDPAGGSRLVFRKNRGGIDAGTGEIDWSAEGPLVYQFTLSPGELDNGLDDNGNGLIDEGQVDRIEGGVTTVIATGIPEGGLAFTRNGERIRIDLALEGRDARREMVRAETTRFVYPRN
jgi:hypothetical protein